MSDVTVKILARFQLAEGFTGARGPHFQDGVLTQMAVRARCFTGSLSSSNVSFSTRLWISSGYVFPQNKWSKRKKDRPFLRLFLPNFLCNLYLAKFLTLQYYWHFGLSLCSQSMFGIIPGFCFPDAINIPF